MVQAIQVLRFHLLELEKVSTDFKEISLILLYHLSQLKHCHSFNIKSAFVQPHQSRKSSICLVIAIN